MKKKYFIILGVMIIIVAMGFRIHGINATAPSEFAVEKVPVNQTGKLDQLELTVKSYSLGEKYHYDGGNPADQFVFQPLSIVVQVKNISTTPQNLGYLNDLALYEGYDFTQTSDITPTVKELAPNKTVELTYTYKIEPDTFNVKDSVLAITSSGLKTYDKTSYLKAYDSGKYLGLTFAVAK